MAVCLPKASQGSHGVHGSYRRAPRLAENRAPLAAAGLVMALDFEGESAPLNQRVLGVLVRPPFCSYQLLRS